MPLLSNASKSHMKFSSIFGWRRNVARAFIYDAEGAGGRGLFLIAKGRIPPRIWHLPGGGIGKVIAEENERIGRENGSKGRQKETPENALRRELFEELCFGRDHVQSVTWVGQRASRVAFMPHLEELFVVRVMPGLSRQPIRKSWELLDAKWVDAAELARLCAYDEAIMEKMKSLI